MLLLLKVSHFSNTNCQYQQNNTFWIIYQTNTQTLGRKYCSICSAGAVDNYMNLLQVHQIISLIMIWPVAQKFL